MLLAHLDPGHFEGHWLYRCLGEHESHSDLHVTHIALRLGQEGEALQAGNNQDVSEFSKNNNTYSIRTMARF